MSSLVNKVKDAIKSDTPDEPADSRHGTTASARSTRGDIVYNDPARRENVENELAGGANQYGTAGQTVSMASRTSHIPGSFPGSERTGTVADVEQHTDGHEYIAPRGTHVGVGEMSRAHHAPRTNYDLPEQAVTGRNLSGYPDNLATGTTPINFSISRHDFDTTENVTGAGLGGGNSFPETHSGHNKLHKKNDPRGHNNTQPMTMQHTSPPQYHHEHGHRHGNGQSHTSQTGSSTQHHYAKGDEHEREASQTYTGSSITSNQRAHQAPETISIPTGVGVGTASAASATDDKHDQPRLHHKSGEKSQGVSERSSEPHRSNASTSIGNEHPVLNTKGMGVYNSITGAGSADDPAITGLTQSSHPGVTAFSGQPQIPREAGNAGLPQSATSRSDNLGTATGTGLETGSSTGGVVGNASHRDHRDLTTSRANQSAHGTTSAQPSATDASRDYVHSAAHRTTFDTAAPFSTKHHIGPQQAGVANTTSHIIPPTDLPHSQISSSIAATDPAPSSTLSSAPPYGAGTVSGSDTYTHPSATAGLGLGTEAGVGHHYYGPGHSGAKVLHTCTKCGEDNDISHYFRRDAVYRISR